MGTVLVTGKARWVLRDGVRTKTNHKDWYVVVDAGHDATGKRRRHWSRKFDTKAAAMRHRNEIAREGGGATWQASSRSSGASRAAARSSSTQCEPASTSLTHCCQMPSSRGSSKE